MTNARRDPVDGRRQLSGDLADDLLAADGIGIGAGIVDVVAGDDEAVLALVEADGRAQDALVDRGVLRPAWQTWISSGFTLPSVRSRSMSQPMARTAS